MRLGRYTVVRRLGAGGMAEVFLARSRGAEGVDKFLVVKRILPEYSENPHFRSMFIDEARIALRLNHPNIVQVYGFESDGSTLLLIMEHVDGPDLALLAATARWQGERVPPPVAAYVVREVARGLHYAHDRADEQGRPLEIVHRDVSPTNVLLSNDGAVKLGDFGIARVRSASQEIGVVQGKYSFMAPEQARGEAVDRRADVYSLGVLLGELLLGRSVFHDVSSGEALLDLVRRGDLPDVERALDGAPGGLRSIVTRAMRANREERFGSAREVGLALTQYLHALDAPADSTALEQFLAKVLPQQASIPPGPAAPSKTTAPPRGGGSSGGATQGAATVPAVVIPGAPAPRAPRVEAAAALRERVHVAVLAGRFSASAAAPETRPLLALIDALAFKADATLEWRRDDSFTLVVGAVRPHVDDALRAARLALDILDSARSVAADAELHGVAAPAVSLGLARGVAGCARDPDGNLISYELVDDAAPMAVSLAAVARPSEALVAGGLYRIVRRAFVLRETSPRGASNARPYVLERMKSRAERDRSTDSQGWSLLGREALLRSLREALEEVRARGSGQGLLLTGELGVGKSTVVGALASGVTAQLGVEESARCVRVDATLASQGTKYGLIAQLVRQVVAMRGDGAPRVPAEVSTYLFDRTPPPDPGSEEPSSDRVEEAVRQWVSGGAAQAAALRALSVCFGALEEPLGEEAATNRELALLLRPMLAEVARDRPLLVLADALDMADAQSRALLADLMRRPPAAAVLVVVSTRSDDPMVAELRSVAQLLVAPLEVDARRRLIASALGADDATEELVREVSAVAGGNPQTLLEVVEALGDRVRLREVSASGVSGADRERVVDLAPTREDELLLASTLEDVLSARIESLAGEARTLLRWCALCEAELNTELVDSLGGNEGPRVREGLCADGILVATPAESGPARMRFAHPALARVARASIDPTAQPAMHARIAELLERHEVPAAARGDYAAAIGRHREAAGVPRPAARAWMEAASCYAAELSRGPEEVLGTFLRVLALCEGATDGEGYVLRAAAHLGREEVARDAGRVRLRRRELLALRRVAAESREVSLVAEALARQARYKLETVPGSDVERDAIAAIRAARRARSAFVESVSRLVLAQHMAQRGRFAEALIEVDTARRALSVKGADDPPVGGSVEGGRRRASSLRSEIALARASMLRQVGDFSGALRCAGEALAQVRDHGHRRLLGRAYDEVGMACLAQGAVVEGLRFFRASVVAERELGARVRMSAGLAHAGAAFAAIGRGDRAVEHLQRALALSAASGGSPGFAAADVHVSLAEIYLRRHEIDAAAVELERARAMASRTGSLFEHFRVHMGDASLYLARKQFRLARVTAEVAERTAREAGILSETLHARAIAAEAAALQGDRMAAWSYLDVVLGESRMADPARVFRGDEVSSACARALQALGDERHSALLLGQAEQVRASLRGVYEATVSSSSATLGV
ncbi:MAG: protein kinase [Polyangiales bacterium]